MDKKCCHQPLTLDDAKKLLSDFGINRTKIKIKILQELSRSPKPLSVLELHAFIKQSCDVSTVFRAMVQFKEKNIVQEVNLEEGFYRYELNTLKNEHSHHHHHIRCRQCGDIQNLEECDLSAFEKAIKKLGFVDMEHRLEFSGVCSRCVKNQN